MTKIQVISLEKLRRQQPRAILKPTRTCFDDTIEILHFCGSNPNWNKNKHTFTIIHGLVEPTDPNNNLPNGIQYPHAWVKYLNMVFEMHKLDNKPIITYRPEYNHPCVNAKVIKQWEYSMHDVLKLTKLDANITSGPWEPELIKIQLQLEQVRDRLAKITQENKK